MFEKNFRTISGPTIDKVTMNLSANLKEKVYLGTISVEGRIILKFIL
jgi:hypothetical protein